MVCFFQNEFEGKQSKYYRVSSSVFNIDKNQPSFVYIRFKTYEDQYKYHIDYIDIREKCTQEQYDKAIKLEEKISFDKIQNYISQNDCVKHVSLNFNKDKTGKIFKDNVITYFPSYRYESPGYLNDLYEINLEFKKKTQFSGYLRNPIEVKTCLLQLANWVMDIALDFELNKTRQEWVLLENISNIFTQTLVSKQLGAVRVGIGQRSLGSARIQIVNKETGQSVYPTIFNLSSGEAAMFCLF